MKFPVNVMMILQISMEMIVLGMLRVVGVTTALNSRSSTVLTTQMDFSKLVSTVEHVDVELMVLKPFTKETNPITENLPRTQSLNNEFHVYTFCTYLKQCYNCNSFPIKIIHKIMYCYLLVKDIGSLQI